MRPRTFREHVGLFAAYADAVAALPTSSWDRLTTTCASLEGDSFGAVLKRARLGARASSILEPLAAHSWRVRGIAAVGTATLTGIGVAAELIGEFGRPRSPSSVPLAVRHSDPTTAKYVEAWFTLEAAIYPVAASHPGLAAAIRAAAQAVLRHDWLSPESFNAVYAFVEPEIPYETLDRGVSGG